MMPNHFMHLASLPLNRSGKLDRQALPGAAAILAARERPFRAPGSPMEERLAEIWAETLNLERVGIDDHFTEIGGTSLHAVRVVSRIMREFQLELPLHLIFEFPTLAKLAEKIEEMILDALENMDDETARKLLEDR
jgi:acyl carrier protein